VLERMNKPVLLMQALMKFFYSRQNATTDWTPHTMRPLLLRALLAVSTKTKVTEVEPCIAWARG
jgi:hypothetical protein